MTPARGVILATPDSHFTVTHRRCPVRRDSHDAKSHGQYPQVACYPTPCVIQANRIVDNPPATQTARKRHPVDDMSRPGRRVQKQSPLREGFVLSYPRHRLLYGVDTVLHADFAATGLDVSTKRVLGSPKAQTGSLEHANAIAQVCPAQGLTATSHCPCPARRSARGPMRGRRRSGCYRLVHARALKCQPGSTSPSTTARSSIASRTRRMSRYS